MSWYGSHIYLNDFIEDNQCRRLMEIGVYNGENALSMIKTAMKNQPAKEVEYYGFDFFKNYSIEKIRLKLEKLGCKYKFFKGNSLETVPYAAKSLPKMDIIFIDGGKSYEEAWSDWKGSSKLMHKGTGVFVHNADFYGIRRMVNNIPQNSYTIELWHANFEGKVALIKRKK